MGHDELAATRRSLHGVAELVLAGPQYRATGRRSACMRSTSVSRREPYAYVGVTSPPAGDRFWNAPFGAAVPLREFPDAPAVTGFFAAGRERAR
jgi:hypothetical protein